ncbi:MAG TPA: hypothetical protein EYO62_02190 [Aquificales bacterium]|nr:hypothetical protein [Aquificales bacterium]
MEKLTKEIEGEKGSRPLKVEDNLLTSKRHELKRIPPQLEKSLEDLERGRVEKFPLEEAD